MSETGTPSPTGRTLDANWAKAAPFVPQQRERIRPIRTAGGGKRDVFASLDAVCFTPSQGVCTPSPTNTAAMWAPQPFQQAMPCSPYAYGYGYAPWEALTGDYGSPGPSDSNLSDASSYQPGSDRSPHHSRPQTPHGPPLLFSSFYYPVPFSPPAMQMAAAYPGTPTRSSQQGFGGSSGFVPTGPFHASPSRVVFSHFFAEGGQGPAVHMQQQAYQGETDLEGFGSGSSDSGTAADGSSGIEVTPGAHQLAQAMLAAQNLQGEPPQQLLELASLLQTYGLVAAGAAGQPAGPAPGAGTSPEGKGKMVKRQKSAPKLNPDGSVRLNARQRRTLRRAQERAMKALVELQQAAHGIDAEQAAANLAAMPLLVMGSGSPPRSEAAYGGPFMGSPVQQLQPIPPAYAAAGMMATPQPVIMTSPFGSPMVGGPSEFVAGLIPMPMAMAPGMHSPGGSHEHAGRPAMPMARGPRVQRLSRFAPAAAY